MSVDVAPGKRFFLLSPWVLAGRQARRQAGRQANKKLKCIRFAESDDVQFRVLFLHPATLLGGAHLLMGTRARGARGATGTLMRPLKVRPLGGIEFPISSNKTS